MYTKILVPVDGSENAALACAHAVDLAKSGDMEIVLLSCYQVRSARIGAGSGKKLIAASLESKCKESLAPCEALCAENGLKYKSVIRRGTPSAVIVQVAEEENCDLIVIGSRGLGNIAGAVMGSVTNKVLKDAPVPVLVVRKKA